MPRYFLASTEERSALGANAPDYELIKRLFQASRAGRIYGPEDQPVPAPRWGNWVGPGPRVTRSTGAASTTKVAWLYEFPDDAFFDAMARNPATSLVDSLRENLDNNLARDVTTNAYTMAGLRFDQPTIVPYNPAVNGPLEFWRSSQASTTQTRDSFAADLAYTDENPVGPNGPTQGRSLIQAGVTDPLLNPLRDAARSASDTASSVGKTILYGGAILLGGVVLYGAAQLYIAYKQPARGARRNPSVSRRRRRRR